MPISNAQLIRRLALMQNDLTEEINDLSEGMWNPQFCSADASEQTKRILDGFRGLLDNLEKTAK